MGPVGFGSHKTHQAGHGDWPLNGLEFILSRRILETGDE
jgi:hypothetical protein